MGKSKGPSETFDVAIESTSVAVHVFYERRRNVRASAGKDAVLLRIPHYTTERERHDYKSWCTTWIHKQWEGNPQFRSTYTRTDFTSLGSISTYDRTFRLMIHYAPFKQGRAAIEKDAISLRLPEDLETHERSAMTYTLIHKALAIEYLDNFKARLYMMHGGNFSRPVQSVKLKNMSSKWGSCSSEGHISLSTRLLFAPADVQDYVLWHELCHLDVLDHSEKFWRHVKRFDPAYEISEQWLRDSGHTCDITHHASRREFVQLQLPFFEFQ